MSALIFMASWVRVNSCELIVQMYVSLYFPFYNFHDDNAFLKINIQRKRKEKRIKVDFPDNIHIMVLLVYPFVFITTLLQKDILRKKTKGNLLLNLL